MTTLLLSHMAMLDHITPPHHPECTARLEAVMKALAAPVFAPLMRREAPMAEEEHLLLAHSLNHIRHIRNAAPREGWVGLDADTILSPGSFEAALRAVGAAITAVKAVMQGEASNAFCAARPPGHHAERETAMGFCFFNQAVIAARYAQKHHGALRVAILDYDVHHGNGTEDCVWDDASIFYASSHQSPLYPGTGDALETGTHGTIVNVPLKAGTGGGCLIAAWQKHIFPRLRDFHPNLIIISSGFDAHKEDPLGGLMLEAEDFAALTREIMKIADDLCEGRLVSILEGGYHLEALAQSVAAHVSALMNHGNKGAGMALA
jgi:acetoin utilization deacetylase AcuC-like enzyme